MRTSPILGRFIATAAILAPILTAAGPAAGATLADTDGDGVSDVADTFPCDWRRSAAAFVPSEGAFGTLLYEDNWPLQGDLDFNDAVVAYNYVVFLDREGRASGVRVTLVPRALGARIDSGLALQLPVPRTALASATLTIGGGAPTNVAPIASEALLTLTIADRLRALFPVGAPSFINTEGASIGDAPAVILDLDFTQSVGLPVSGDVFDLFFFRTTTPRHEVHRPQFSGTGRMDTALFGSGDDASSGARRFVDRDGLPFVLALPAQVAWPTERTRIERLWPSIVGFAASAGARDAGFYQSVGDVSASFAAALGLTPGATPTDRCVLPTCTDGARNGVESDVDCGGSCGACSVGRACAVHADCASAACLEATCVAETTRACVVDHGSGLSTPDSTPGAGAAWTTCVATACDAGHHVEASACVADRRACAGTNGTGTQTWSGGAWGACALDACVADHHLEGGACVSDVRACAFVNGAGTQRWAAGAWGACSVSRCDAGYHVEAGACALDVRACSLANGVGQQTWANGWGACAPTACDAGFHAEGNACVADSRTCAIANGVGTQAWRAGAWSACALASCNVGYRAVDGACRIFGSCVGLKEADPTATSGVYAIDPAGTGSPVDVYCDMETDGGGWTMVYKHSAGTTIPAANTTFGAELGAGPMNELDASLLDLRRASRRYVSRLPSLYWSSFTQARVAVAVGGVVVHWMLYDTTASTPDGWMTRARLLDSSWQDLLYRTQNYWGVRGDEGNRRHFFVNQNYGGCPADAGWLVVTQGSVCSWETTRPNSVLYAITPTIQNWTTGAAVGQADALVVSVRERRPANAGVCASSARLEGGACVANVRGCAITNGHGTQAWSGGVWGACAVASCDASFHAEGSGCVSDTRSCTIANGTGVQTWSGGAWSSCTFVSCNAGFHREGGVCTSDTRACAVLNGVGAETWNGSGYGVCAPTSCNAGFHVEAGACVTNTRGCPIANGTGAQTWTGSGYGACAPTSCNTGFHVESGACASDTRACTVANGTGTQTWSGGAWGACTISSCSAGYVLSNNTCRIYSSCLALKEANASLPDGVYTIDPANNGSLLQVWCDMTTDGGGWTMIYKHSAGTPIPAATTGFGNEFTAGALNETDASLLGRQRSSARYVSSLVTRYWASFAQARVEVVVGGNVVQWMTYDIAGSTADAWFVRSRLRDSSWVDILRQSQNYWSFRGDEGIRRHMFINQNYGGCPADVGWLAVVQSNTCSWESTRPNSILYANAFTGQNWTTGAVGQADAIVITLRERRPNNAVAGPSSCVALRNQGQPSGFYTIDVLGSGGGQRVYCDMTTDGGGWALAYKHSSGVNRVMADDITSAAVNPTNETLMDRGLETADFAGRLWSTLYFSRFTEARLEVVSGGVVRQFVVFSLANQTQTGFFQRSTVTRTSWTDLTTAPVNIFSMAGEPSCPRRAFMNSFYNGCPADQGWLVALGGTGCNCAWETGNANQVMYATATTRQNWTTGAVARADAIVIWLR